VRPVFLVTLLGPLILSLWVGLVSRRSSRWPVS
jgi:hypothetical protein